MKRKSKDELLREFVSYNPETGCLYWNKDMPGGAKRGDPAGWLTNNGYLKITLMGEKYYAHRVAWFLHNGYFPENCIDHINEVKTDNRILNLREVSKSCNAKNTGNFAHNSSGVRGVSWVRRINKWESYIQIRRRKKHLGFYDDLDEAVCARLAAEQCVGWGSCRLNSPAQEYVSGIVRAAA